MMGSGKKFRIGLMERNVTALALSVVHFGEHTWSIYIELIKIRIYIGFGKGYDE